MKLMYYNKEYRKEFKKIDCPEDLGTTEVFVVPEAQFCSTESQEAADKLAADWAEVEGPKYANIYGGCCNVYYSKRQFGYFFKDDCPEGYEQEEAIYYEIEKGRAWSRVSVEDANRKAAEILKAEGQAAANSSGICKPVYYNEEQGMWFTKDCGEGWTSQPKYRTIAAGVVKSFVSIEDANNKAKEKLANDGQEWVDYNMKCTPINDFC